MSKYIILEEICKDLDNIENILNSKGFKVVDDEQSTDYYQEKSQGHYGTKTTIFSDDTLFIQINKTTDSYGDNEHITLIKFVEPVKKQITVYE